jgi:hypothetical protein
MKSDLYCSLAVFAIVTILTGCGIPPATPATTETQAQPTAPAATSTLIPLTSTADPCLTPQIEKEVQEVQKHMREFDDAAKLATFVPRDQLSNSIAELQRIRRGAEDEEIPPCLTNLKSLQVQHMNMVIDTLVGFMSGIDQQSLDQGIAFARQLHDQYTLEVARVLGITVVVATMPPPATATPTP